VDGCNPKAQGVFCLLKNKVMIYKFKDSCIETESIEVHLDDNLMDVVFTCLNERQEASIMLTKQDIIDLIEVLKTIETKMKYE
jgi:hypothetical protein